MHTESTKGSFLLLLARTKTYQTEIMLTLFVLFLIKLFLNFLNSKRKNFPPGPSGLPLVGYLPFIRKDTHLNFIELGKKFGGVFSLKLGSKDVVVLNDSEAIKEAMTKKEIQGRDKHGALGLVVPESAFFAKSNDVWREQRRFVVHSMKDLGLGKSKVEQEIQEEIGLLLEVLKNSNGQPFDLKKPLSPSMSNNICALMFGKRYEYNDPIRTTLDAALDTGVRNLSQMGPAVSFPWLLSIPFVRSLIAMKTAVENFNIIKSISMKEIENHKESFDSKNVRDFIDSYLVEMDKKKDSPSSSFDEDTLIANLVDVFSAGSETVRTSILWCIYVIAAYPEVQKKVQKEILDVIGSERSPQYLDQKDMPYTHAVILEILRWKTIVPVNVARCVTSDTKVAGFDIPKGTTVLSNIWSVHHDPKLWDDPDTFKPERFLSADKGSVAKSSNFMLFSLGKRACPGETLAYIQVFLYFTSILQKFDVVLPDGAKPDLEGELAVAYLPKPFQVQFIQQM